MADLGAYLTSINKTKTNIMREPQGGDATPITAYPAFIVRRLLSYHPDAIAAANMMNMYSHLDNQLQYEFLLYFLPKKNRFARMEKANKDENIELLKRHYNYSEEKAIDVLALHSEKYLQDLRASYQEGGVKKK